nr:hypothetical protein [uncultured Rhodopila sp.]
MSNCAAADFLVFDHALRLHETLTRDGFVLQDRARVHDRAHHLAVQLVWRHESTRDSATLSLRVRRMP